MRAHHQFLHTGPCIQLKERNPCEVDGERWKTRSSLTIREKEREFRLGLSGVFHFVVQVNESSIYYCVQLDSVQKTWTSAGARP